ncbi:MAG: LacI family DNA-binding transcriptional regulator [Verrucomicrobiota bacterium]
MGKRVSLKDVAKEANVSVITASRAIRGIGRVNPGTRRTILEAATALGYKRHGGHMLNGFGTGSHAEHCLRILLPIFKSGRASIDNVFASRIVHGLEDVLRESGGQLTITEVDDVDDLLQNLPRAKVHGIVLRQVLPVAWLDQLKMIAPTVYAIAHDVQPGVDCVYFNEFKSTAMIYDELLAKGHRQFVWVSTDRSNPLGMIGDEFYDPRSGYDRQALNYTRARNASWNVIDLGQRGSDVEHQYITIEQPLLESGLEADVVKAGNEVARALLALKRLPSAVIINSDDIALHACKVLTEKKVKIPEDLSMVTYYSSQLGVQLKTKISGIRLPFGQVGRIIPEIIQRRVTQPEAPYISVALEPEFVDRGTIKIRRS